MTDQEIERTLIARVVADPAADAPRLAYADWLVGQGRADRAELIRVQCQLDRLHARERVLLDAHGGEWGDRLRDFHATGWAFHRGFPEDIRIGTEAYLRFGDDIAATTPVSRLRLIGADDALLGQFATLPGNRHLRALEVGKDEGGFGPDGIRALARSPHLSGLRELRLHSNAIGPDGVYHVCHAPFTRNLTHLTLNDRHLATDEGRSFLDVAAALDPRVVQELNFAGDVHGPKSVFFATRRAGDAGPRSGPAR